MPTYPQKSENGFGGHAIGNEVVATLFNTFNQFGETSILALEKFLTMFNSIKNKVVRQTLQNGGLRTRSPLARQRFVFLPSSPHMTIDEFVP